MSEQPPNTEADKARSVLAEAYGAAPQAPEQNATALADHIMEAQPTAGDGSTPAAEHAAQFGPPTPDQLAEYGQGAQPPAGQAPEQLPPQPH